ncbi:MAG: radical SAM protein [Acidobacteriota bacterium]
MGGALAALELERCELCEHRCAVDRTRELGVCRLPAQARVYRAFLHHGEEPEYSPTFALFLTGCSFRCAYCSEQAEVADPAGGVALDVPALLDRIAAAAREGARSVSFIGGNPDESLVALLPLVSEIRALPVVWNSNLYLTAAALGELLPHVRTFVPDYKFGNDACARRIARAGSYTETLQRNLRIVHRTTRVIVRHLVMPGHLECCLEPVCRFVARELPRATCNLMTQYEPLFAAGLGAFPPLDGDLARRPGRAEIDGAIDAARRAGLDVFWVDGKEAPRG